MDSITPVMFITANVGSIFENPSVMLKIWTEEFLSTVVRLNPKFIALHCQEVGGKNYEHSMQPVEEFVKLLMESEELRLFDKVRVFLDEDFSSAENFTALGNFYFIHESITDLLVWDFKEMKFCPVPGKEVHTGSIEHVPIKEKSKFPQDLFPECKWSRKGFLRTRWNLNGSVFDLINIHLFHDASNFIAMETSPSVYSVTRQRALEYTLDRFQTDTNGAVPFFLFGDFNFRTNTQAVIERLVNGLDPVQIQSPNSEDVQKLLYKKEGNEIVLTLGKKEFVHSNHQQIFVENSGEWLKEFDNERDSFAGLLFEFPISFPPSYPFEEDAESGSLYTTTRCPAWCDRVVLSSAAKKLIYDISNNGSIEYDLMGKSTCMGDHKPVYLRANIINSAGIIEQNLSHVVNPFMLVLCACKLKKLLNWQHDKHSTPNLHGSKSSRLAIVAENGSPTVLREINVNTTVVNGSKQFIEGVDSENKGADCNKKLWAPKKCQLEDLSHSDCGCSVNNRVSQLDGKLNSRSVFKVKKMISLDDPKMRWKSETNLKSQFLGLSSALTEDCSYPKYVPVINNYSCIEGYRHWKSCSDFESSKMRKYLPGDVKNSDSKENQIHAELGINKNVENPTKLNGSLNLDSIVDGLDSDEALIVNVDRRTDSNEPDEVALDDVSSCSSKESLSANQRISISKLKLDKLPLTNHSNLSDDKCERSSTGVPSLSPLKGSAIHYRRLVKRVNSASMIENKRTIVLKKTETCHCMTNSNEAYIDIFGDEYRTRSSSISAPNHAHRRMKLISDPILKSSLPRLTSHHSSSDEEWYEQILEADSPQKRLGTANDVVNNNDGIKSFRNNNNISEDAGKHQSRHSLTADVITVVNHHSTSKMKASSEKLNFSSDCKLLFKLKRKEKSEKEEKSKFCSCCVIS